MLSSQGNAITAPAPRNIARREMVFFVMITASSLLFGGQDRLSAGETHLKRRAIHDSQYHGRPAIILGSRVARNLPDKRIVGRLDAAADGIGEKLLGEGAHEILLVALDQPPQPGDSGKLSAVRQRGGGVNRRPVTFRAPFPERVEILQGKTKRVHPLMAGGANGGPPMQLHPLAQRLRLAVLARLFQSRDIGRRRRRRSAQEIRQQPPAAERDGSAVGIGRDSQDAGLSQKPSAYAVRELHTAKTRPVNIGYAVVLRQPFVQKTVIGRNQFHNAAVFPQLARDK